MKLRLTEEQLEMGVAELDEYGLGQREINFLEEKLHCLYVRELVELRPEQIVNAVNGGPKVRDLIRQAVVNLAAGHKVKAHEELTEDDEDGAGDVSPVSCEQ